MASAAAASTVAVQQKLARKPGKAGVAIFALSLFIGFVYSAIHLGRDLSAVRTTSIYPFLLLGVAVEHRAEPRDGVGTHDAGGNDSFGVPFLALPADLALRGGARPQAKAAGANSRLGGSKYSRLLLQWSLSSPRPGSDCGCAPADHFVRPGVGEIPADRRCLCHFPVTVVI